MADHGGAIPLGAFGNGQTFFTTSAALWKSRREAGSNKHGLCSLQDLPLESQTPPKIEETTSSSQGATVRSSPTVDQARGWPYETSSTSKVCSSIFVHRVRKQRVTASGQTEQSQNDTKAERASIASPNLFKSVSA